MQKPELGNLFLTSTARTFSISPENKQGERGKGGMAASAAGVGRKGSPCITELAPDRQPGHHPTNIIDPEILLHHIPGGMISNLRSQLEQQGALDRLNEVLEELPRTRADLGYPPLVTPTSQIVGVQSVMNVLAGERYAMVPEETRNYVRGLYGRSPAPIDPEVKRKILGKEKVIVCRPADLLPPMLPNATKDIDPKLIESEEDIISFCLFPEVAIEFFKWRAMAPEDRPSSPADLELRKIKEAKDAKVQPAAPATPLLGANDYKEIQGLLDKVNALKFTELTIRRNDVALSLKASGMSVSRVASEAASTETAAPVTEAPAAEAPAKVEAAPAGPTIDAPLNGTFYTSTGPGKPSLVKPGDTVKAGDPVCIVEAMKLFNQIKAPFDCKIVRFLAEHGGAAKKGQPLVAVEKL